MPPTSNRRCTHTICQRTARHISGTINHHIYISQALRICPNKRSNINDILWRRGNDTGLQRRQCQAPWCANRARDHAEKDAHRDALDAALAIAKEHARAGVEPSDILPEQIEAFRKAYLKAFYRQYHETYLAAFDGDYTSEYPYLIREEWADEPNNLPYDVEHVKLEWALRKHYHQGN